MARTWIDLALDDYDANKPVGEIRVAFALFVRMTSYLVKGVALLWAVLLPITLLTIVFFGRAGIPLEERISGWIVGSFGLAVLLSPGGMMFFLHRDIKRRARPHNIPASERKPLCSTVTSRTGHAELPKGDSDKHSRFRPPA